RARDALALVCERLAALLDQSPTHRTAPRLPRGRGAVLSAYRERPVAAGHMSETNRPAVGYVVSVSSFAVTWWTAKSRAPMAGSVVGVVQARERAYWAYLTGRWV